MMDFLISICLGIGLAAAAGFRVFLPLLALSCASYFNSFDLAENWLWLGSLQTLIILGVASVLELLAYYIPLFDNLLDTLAVPLATVAGAVLFFVSMGDSQPWVIWSLALIGGGGTAGLVAGSTAAVRAVSSTTTLGFANPLFSTFENGISIFLSILSIFIPVVAGIVVVYIIYRSIKWLKSRKLKTKI